MTLADYFRVLRLRARVWIVCVVLGIGLAVARRRVIQQHGLDLCLLPVLEPALVECVGIDTGASPDRQQQPE